MDKYLEQVRLHLEKWWLIYGKPLEAFWLEQWQEEPELTLILSALSFFAICSLFFLLFYFRRKSLSKEVSQEIKDEAQKTEKSIAADLDGDLRREAVVERPWKEALRKSREPFLGRLQRVWDELKGEELWGEGHPVWESLEEALLGSDVGPRISRELLDSLQEELKNRPSPEELQDKLREYMYAVFERVPKEEKIVTGPRVTVMIGVNGSGKTTTAGKLAYQAKEKGKSVLLGAGDTFRAAAVEQLKSWADSIGVECILPAKGANPAAVAFDAVASGLARNVEEIIIDTAGRLHNNEALMEELKKLGRVIEKKIPDAPHEVLLVLDATLGQNALIQAREFSKALPATGVVLTKLDGSAKGGVVFSVVLELGIPVKMVGVGRECKRLASLFSS